MFAGSEKFLPKVKSLYLYYLVNLKSLNSEVTQLNNTDYFPTRRAVDYTSNIRVMKKVACVSSLGIEGHL